MGTRKGKEEQGGEERRGEEERRKAIGTLLVSETVDSKVMKILSGIKRNITCDTVVNTPRHNNINVYAPKNRVPNT
jgi:hypothetical protein